MPEIFICADLHFNHKNIIAYENRPWPDRDAMNQGLITNWNRAVSPCDTVFVLGDVGFCSSAKVKELVTQLNGEKILIMGNHDRDRSCHKWMEIGFAQVSRTPMEYQFQGRKLLLMHEPPEQKMDKVFFIYGHVHGDPKYPDWTPDSACVSIERLNFAPAKLQSVIDGTAYAHR